MLYYDGMYADPHDERAKAARRRHYEKNKEAYIARTRQRERELLEYVRTIKDQPCMDCGVRYNPWIMEFDHREPSEKIANINTIIASGNKKKLLEELEKCDVVCANCHRERTYKMFGWK